MWKRSSSACTLGIGLDVLVGEGLPVAAEELPDVLGAARVARAEQDHVVAVLGHQRHAPQDEGAHQDLAQLRVALHQGAQVVAIDGDDRAVARGARAHQAAPRREHVDLAGELPGAVHDRPAPRDRRSAARSRSRPTAPRRSACSARPPRTAPRPRGRRGDCPTLAMRSICAGVSSGNICAARSITSVAMPLSVGPPPPAQSGPRPAKLRPAHATASVIFTGP